MTVRSESNSHAATSVVAQRPMGLLVVRESDQWDMELFNAMREQTYLQHRGVPEIEAIRQAGLAPLEDDSFTIEVTGDAVPQRIIVEHMVVGTSKAILFYYGGYWHLWSRASAASVGKDGVNDFTAILIDVVKRVRPLNLYAANFSRLIRSQSQGNRLQADLDGNVDVVWAGSVPFHFTGPSAQVGMMMFSMFSMVASMERDWIVQRLLTGRIAKWRRGEWPFGAATIPHGYMLDGDHRLVPNPELRASVREMLIILSNPETPNGEKVRQLSRAGVYSMRKHRRLGERIPVGAMRGVDSLVASLYAWAPLYVQGEYLWRMANVFRDLEELAGVPVVRDERIKNDLGEMQMLYKIPLLDDGWAEPEVLSAFSTTAADYMAWLVQRGATDVRPIADTIETASVDPALHIRILNPDRARWADAAQRERRSRARSKKTIAPLAGRNWVDGDWHYELQVVSRKSYRLVRWPLRNGRSVQIGVDQ